MKKKRILTLCLLAHLFLYLPAWAKPVTIEIDNTQNGPTINKDIYGQFAEHLGHGIYGGIYVGNDSKIPNTNGFRNDVIRALKDLQVPLVRWPGGCFADEYHWRDGIGPTNKRPVKVNTHWGGVEENNSFGTHEFFDLVEMIGADAYVNGNLGTGSPQEMAEWLEYMTSNTNSTLVQERRKNGRDKPWKIAYFGIGNESWGCGGNMRPEYYADLYRHYSTFLKAPGGAEPKMVASGGQSDLTVWTDLLSKNIKQKMAGISHHYYTLPTNNWEKKGKATGFPESEWISTIINTKKMDSFIEQNIAVLDKNDPDGKLGFYIDEWGTWYDPTEGKESGFLWQRNTLRDAMVAAINLNIFHKYAQRVHMTNIAQMVNVLQAMILTDQEKMVLTPTYHVFKLYTVFQGATALPIKHEKLPTYTLGELSTDALSFSAAKGNNGKLYLAVANVDTKKDHEVQLNLKNGAVTTISGKSLSAVNIDDENTFSTPTSVTPKNINTTLHNGLLTVPAKTIMVLAL